MSEERDTLASYHTTPGQTPAMLEAWRDHRDQTTYQVLVERAAGLAREARILDLACGDWFLIEQLRHRGFEKLEGLDSSAEELSVALAPLRPDLPLYQETQTRT